MMEEGEDETVEVGGNGGGDGGGVGRGGKEVKERVGNRGRRWWRRGRKVAI